MPIIYEVIGTLAVPGNSSHPAVGQSINYSFELDYSQLEFDFPTVVGTPVVTSFGPLGTFTLGNVSSQGDVGFFSSVEEIDLLFNSLSSPPAPGYKWTIMALQLLPRVNRSLRVLLYWFWSEYIRNRVCLGVRGADG